MDSFIIPWKTGTGNILVKKVEGSENKVIISSDSLNTTSDIRTQVLTFTSTDNPEDTTTLTVSQKPVDNPEEFTKNAVWWFGITPGKAEDWKLVYPTLYSTHYLLYKPEENNNWWDVKKQNPTANPDGVKDGMMCWAAASSNLLHWWIHNNLEYVKQYDYKGPDYEWHSDQPQESDIFTLFVDTFEDEAGYTDSGLNWFIHGTPVSSPSQMPGVNNPGGFFKDVFPEGVKLGANIAGNGKEIFNNTIKDAIANHKAVGVNIGSVLSSHAVVIWGVEFDETGTVSHIYLVDNNDREQYEAHGYGCIRLKIVYTTSPEGASMVEYYSGFIGGDPSKTKPISRLITLDLGTKYWEEYVAGKNKELYLDKGELDSAILG